MIARFDGKTEFITFSLWESLDAVKAFAGDDHEAAVLYPEDEKYLIEPDDRTLHYQIAASIPGAGPG